MSVPCSVCGTTVGLIGGCKVCQHPDGSMKAFCANCYGKVHVGLPNLLEHGFTMLPRPGLWRYRRAMGARARVPVLWPCSFLENTGGGTRCTARNRESAYHLSGADLWSVFDSMPCPFATHRSVTLSLRVDFPQLRLCQLRRIHLLPSKSSAVCCQPLRQRRSPRLHPRPRPLPEIRPSLSIYQRLKMTFRP